MAGKTSGPGPSEQEIRMVTLERKFDELLSFVQLIAKRTPDGENQRKEDDKDTNSEEPEGHSNTNTTPPRPPTPPKPEGKDSQLDSKIDSLEEKIRLIQGARSRMVLAVEEDLSLEGAGGYLPGPIRWREKAARACPPLDEREMIKIFVDTLKNPYFDRMIGLQMQFFVDLIPVGERIEDAVKTKKIVDMTALMALAEQAAKKAPTKKKEGDVQMIGRNSGRPRQALPTFTMQPIQPRPAPIPVPTQVPAPSPNNPDTGETSRKPSLPNITTNPLPNHPEGGVNMVEIEEEGDRIDSAGDRILWRRLFHTLEKQGHITPLEAPPGPSTGDACEYHSGARGHSLECCEEFKKEVSNLMEKGLVRREKIPSEGSRQPYDPSDLDWYAELNLDDIVEDEMDLDDLMDEGDAQGYFMEDDTDEWRDVDFSELLQFPCLIAPKESDMSSLPTLAEEEEEEQAKPPPPSNATTTTAEEEHADPLVEGLSIHAITEEGDSTTPPIRYCQQGEEAKTWTSMPLLQRISSSNEIARKTSNDPHVSKIDNKADCSLDNIDNSDEEVELPNDILEALERQDEGSKPNIEELEIINLADGGEEPREVKIGTRSTTEQKEALIALLREFHEIFAWSYQDMPGLDTDIVVHKIPLKPECKPVKQALRRMKPEVILKIKEEVEKQLKAGFLSTVTYSDWVANIVPVPKKDGKVRMCVDYRDLNRASPKDNFPLPHIDTLVDNTATNAVFSFMDGFSGYNQIKMAEEDKSKTAFVTHWGTFVYDVMPFGLKNAGATYQRAMVTLFHDMIHHEIEVYVDDMIAKSRTTQDHLTDLRKLFQRLKKYQLRLNPNKCAFGVTSGKLLGFIVSGKGIEIDPAKVQAIRSMPAPKTEKEIRSFLGRINYIARFIAQLTATCEPLFKLLRKDVKIKWTEDCQKAFDKIKEYLLNPPILVPPTPGCPLILYLTVQEASMGCMLGQQDETGRKEQAIYYLSKKFTEPETSLLAGREDVLCTGLGLQETETVHALLHHLVGIPNGPDQGQAIADYLADYPSKQLELMNLEFLDEDVMTVEEGDHCRWKLYFDGAANSVGSGIGAVLVSPKGQQTPIAVKLGFDCTNNMTEYEACIVGLQAALEFGAYELEVFGDSLLIVSQTNGEWQARDPKLIPYQRYISQLVPKFKYITFTYTLRAHNHFADALATLASLIKLAEGDDVRSLRIETRDIPTYCVCVEECMNVEAEMDNKPWYYDIKRFIQDREYPPRATENEKKYIRRMAFQFFLSGEILYKRTHDATLLRCVDAEEANRLIQEMHTGLMGAHANGPFLARKIMRAGYYWLTMERDCIRHVQTCHKCQMYQNCKNAPPQYLHTMASSWPFSAWGMDVIGAITPKASKGHEFILVAIDYFTKWVEACSLKNVTQVAVTRFVKNNIVCLYGMPEMLITDNSSNLNNRMMDQLCQQFKIQHHNSAPYRPKMNGTVEAANKNVKKILSKMTETYKDWHEHLPYALCAYRTSVRTSVGATPYSLVYGMEAVLPVEVEIPSLRILSQTQLEEAKWAQVRYEQLNFIDEKRLAALCHGTTLPETDRKSLQQEGATSHFPARGSRSEEEEHGPFRLTREVRAII
uniref:Uncharacterized protein n=1 Tax=Fagus sylvatica TaxID=28930 RepID=A0A2N9HFP0_FAGSY